MTPITPNNSNARRQERLPRMKATSSGVNAPPHRALSHIMPCARTRSREGSQVVKAFVRLGKHPASPAPNKARVTSSEARFHTQAVAAVKNDHQMTILINTFRAPQRSPIQPPGISNSA